MKRPEILAPAGDNEALEAAMRAGADAVYFGLSHFNARARATNFEGSSLDALLASLHARGAKGYVTLNTLVFDHELPAMEAAIRQCAEAGVDAVIVQDLGVLRMVRAIAPDLRVHASTQMTCTDASSVLFAKERGVKRVVLARELSAKEIGAIRTEAEGMELEVFVHGALCIAYSGQCLTSEAIGGRSANRGACAQACRLPYSLIVDGQLQDLGERAYLLSPEDLEGSRAIPELAAIGVESLKIEGRLKGPAYVAATTQFYRDVVDRGLDAEGQAAKRSDALQTYSRGSGPGFLLGIDHQRLVEARGCDHRGIFVGAIEHASKQGNKTYLALRTGEDLARGDGVLIEGGREGSGEVGGRIWTITDARGEDVTHASSGEFVLLWLGPDVRIPHEPKGRRLFKNDDPALEKEILARLQRDPHREPITMRLEGEMDAPFVLSATSPRGLHARVTGDANITQATKEPVSRARLEEALSRLGETTFSLGALELALPEQAFLPVSSLHRARRALTDALTESGKQVIATTPVTASQLEEHASLSLGAWQSDPHYVGHSDFDAHADARRPAPPGLFVLARNEAQARAALLAGADGVYLDFLELTGLGQSFRALKAEGARFVGVAPPRIRKPGEEKIQSYLDSLNPDAVLVRGLGLLREIAARPRENRPLFIGDFSLNVTNLLSANEVISSGLDAFVPSFDLDGGQLLSLLKTQAGRWAELVIHHPMPLFHMEHCVIAALLSEGKDHRDCGRPCEKHVLSLRDRAGMDHPVEADVGCRNTVFHQSAQSAAGLLKSAQEAHTSRFRIELVRETAEDTQRIVKAYRGLLDGRVSAQEVLKSLRAEGHYGVVRGSLRVIA
jgi:putative protease